MALITLTSNPVRIYLTGVACVGKTAVGSHLAELLSYSFFDLDEEVERHFGTSLERLQNQFLTAHSYRYEAAKALSALLVLRPPIKGETITSDKGGDYVETSTA
jgi:shikimate kinase